jgi:TonB-dependent starch-binding outer membrane protein SusC
MNMGKLLYSIGVPVLLLFSFASFAQDKVITGRVTDSIGNGIANVSVTVKEAPARGTTTTTDGRFSLSVPANATRLVFSSVGYAYREMPISGSTVNVSLTGTTSDLNTVVVIGYGTVRKKDLTGSVVNVTAKDFQKGAIVTPEQLIAGKVAGVSITPNNGAPGSGSTIRIRGGSSLNASNDPLIVIDGMPLSNSGVAGVANALALVNPNDIASFTVLKDASATAIYGSRASNGVILITTKKGQSGKPKFNFSTQLFAGVLQKEFPVLSAQQFRDLVNAHGSTTQKNLMGTESTDWQKEIYQTAISSDNNLSVTGSLKDLPYRLSAGYLHQTGILKTGYLDRLSTSLNLNPTLLDNHLKVDFNVRGTFSKSRFANSDAVWGANQFDPTQPVYAKSNRYGGYWERLDPADPTGLANLSPKNPVGLLNQKHDEGHANRLITNVSLDYKLHFLPDLHAVVNGGYDYSKGYGDVVWDDSAASVYKSFTSTFDNSVHSGYRSHYESDINNWFSNFYLNYTKNLDAKNKIEAMAGYEYQDYLTTNHNFKTYAGDTAVRNTPQYPFDKPEYRIQSLLGRLNYSYNNMLFLTGTFRRDGSSRFAPAYRWANFPSGALAFSLDQLSGLKNSKDLSNLKLRVGYGITGQQEGIGLYDYISYYGLSNDKGQYQLGTFYQMYRPGGYYANRKWEQTATTNIGVDWGFFNNRLTGTIEVYKKKTSDLLNQITQPAFTNFSNTIVANVGTMENKGVELTIGATPVKSKTTVWDFSFNATYNENKITKLDINDIPNYVNQIAGIGGNGGVIANAVGYPRGTFYVFKQIYDKTTGKPIENLYEDQNRDGIINTSDLILFKSSIPKWFFGFSTNVNYQKWTASLTLRSNLGNYVFNNVATNGAYNKFLFSSYLSNQSSDVLNTNFEGVGNFYQSNYYVQNGSFLKMDNINVAYNLGRVSKNVNLRLNAGVQNVFTVTNYTGIDPEISGGIDNNGYPRPRTFTIGAGLDF